MENNKNIIAQEQNKSIEVAKGLSVDTLYEEKKRQATRNGQMITFNDLRIGLGGGDKKWGIKVFFKSAIDIGLLELCEDKYKTTNDFKKDIEKYMEKREKIENGTLENCTYCPTTKALDSYLDIFYYDTDKRIWGFSRSGISRIEEEIIPILSRRAEKVRAMFAEQKRLRDAAARAVKAKGRDTLF